MIKEFLETSKSNEVYNEIINRMIELEMNIPESWKPDWACVRDECVTVSFVPVVDVDLESCEVISYRYSFTRLYEMMPKRIKVPYKADFIMVIDCSNDRIKINWNDDPGVTIRDFHESDLTTNIADAFIWWLKSNYFKPVFMNNLLKLYGNEI